ncbi:hypothetical protein ACIGFL_14420 [Pseudomonas sp. NPDC077649]|uniref:hypothetical protein n=1 Tax=Pseudomonas sp. NPDC077649 TaxID=3364423 RepID=UPI0037CA1E10
MQSDDRLAKLAEMLKDERGELPEECPPAAAPIKIKGGGHINLGGTQVNINSAPAPDLLSPEQRRRLNRLVTEISTEHQADPRLLWKEVVHTRTGVSSIEDIPRDKFAEAEQALLDHAEQLHAQAHAKRLVDEVEEVAKQRGIYQQMMRFCSREFGSTSLTRLRPEQLKAVLRYVDEYQAPRHVAAPLSVGGFRQLAVAHPWHMSAVLLAGVVIGRIF